MIRVYLCTYNGARYLGAQLESLRAQTCQDFTLMVSDDGSRDETRAIVERFRGKLGQGIDLFDGPGRGAAANFLASLLRDGGGHNLYAFCDQDDIWEQDKLMRAAAWFSGIPEDVPALYGARVLAVDQDNRELGLSAQPHRPLSFANALVQNFTGGNAMMFNRAARNLIAASLGGIDIAEIPVHDWWAYLVVAGAGGTVFCDDYACLRYRQHRDNVIGVQTGLSAIRGRFARLSGGNVRRSIDLNIAALQRHNELLTEVNRALLGGFAEMRRSSFLSRVLYALRCPVYRQNWQWALRAAILCRRV